MLALLAARAASAWCESTIDVDYYGPSDDLVWPSRYAPAPVDTILVIRRLGVGEIGEIVVRDPYGLEVEAVRYDLTSLDGGDWAVLVPVAPLLPGEGYTVQTDDLYTADDFDVGTELAALGTEPIPVTRSVHSEVTWQDADCPEQAQTSSELGYRLCNAPALTLLTLGDSEPAVPSLSAPGDLVLAGTDTVELSQGLSAGLATTVWLGGFDAAGRFTGWTADPLQMPQAGTITRERAEGASGGPSTTPTAFLECPDSAIWTQESSQTCETWDLDTRDCLLPDGTTDTGEATDTGDTTDTGGEVVSKACSCTTGSRSGGWAWPLAALLWVLRSRSTAHRPLSLPLRPAGRTLGGTPRS